MRWFYYVVLGLALFCGVFAAFSGHWVVAFCAGVVLGFFVMLPDEGL